MSDKQYDNRNRFVLFPNEKRRDDKDPNTQGSINIDGREFWLSGWTKATKDGKKIISGTVKPKMAQEHQGATKNPPAQKAEPEFNDEIPFLWAFALPVAGLLVALISSAPVAA